MTDDQAFGTNTPPRPKLMQEGLDLSKLQELAEHYPGPNMTTGGVTEEILEVVKTEPQDMTLVR